MDVFGKEYDYKHIEHAAGAFFDTAYALRDVANLVPALAQRHATEKKLPIKQVLRQYRRRLWCDPDLFPDGHFNRISSARSAVDWVRPALYVAELGPLYRAHRHITDKAVTVFDRVLDRLDEIVKPIRAAIPSEWTKDYEAWDALKPRYRYGKMLPVYFAAVSSSHDRIITSDKQYRVDDMWRTAQIAHRLMETLGKAHQPLLDGSLVLAEIGYLVCASPGYGGQIDDGYPVADRFPQSINESEDWQRYATLVSRLRSIAPLIDVAEIAVTDALCVAEQLALAQHRFATGFCDQGAVDRAAAHFDSVAFSKAYWHIRLGIQNRLRSLIPDTGKMWAEAFGRWAAEVSTEDAAILNGVLPEAVSKAAPATQKQSAASGKSVKAKKRHNPRRRSHQNVRRNKKRIGRDNRTATEIADLKSKTPALDTGNGKWVRNKKAAEKDGVEVATLATYRKAGINSEDKMLGKDQYGRIWRRRGTLNSHPWYLKSTLQNPG